MVSFRPIDTSLLIEFFTHQHFLSSFTFVLSSLFLGLNFCRYQFCSHNTSGKFLLYTEGLAWILQISPLGKCSYMPQEDTVCDLQHHFQQRMGYQRLQRIFSRSICVQIEDLLCYSIWIIGHPSYDTNMARECGCVCLWRSTQMLSVLFKC